MIIDGVRYVPAVEVNPVADESLRQALQSLTEIQYFSECEHKHRAWAWDALNALNPELAKLAADSPKMAFDAVREIEE